MRTSQTWARNWTFKYKKLTGYLIIATQKDLQDTKLTKGNDKERILKAAEEEKLPVKETPSG